MATLEQAGHPDAKIWMALIESMEHPSNKNAIIIALRDIKDAPPATRERAEELAQELARTMDNGK